MQWRRIIYYTSYNVDHDDEGIRTPKYSWWMYNVYMYIYLPGMFFIVLLLFVSGANSGTFLKKT